MKKKIMSVLLAFMLILSQFGCVYAQDNTTGNTLTVDEAVSKAIAYSRSLKTLYENNEVNELSEHDTRVDLRWSNEYVEVTNLNAELKSLMNSLNNYNDNVAIEKEKIRLNVVELFAAIINAENSVKLYDKQIELNEQELKIAQVKNKLGLISKTEYDAMVVNNKNVVGAKQSVEAGLQEAYLSLNKILGQDLQTSYSVVLDIDYNALNKSESEAEYAITKAVASSKSVKQKEEEANIAKYKLDVYSSEYSGGYKQNAQNNYAQATRAVADAKTDIEVSLRTIYNSIITAENNYKNNLLSLEQKQAELEVKASELKLGKITQLEYDNAEYELSKLKNTIEQSVYSHYVLVDRFNNPDLL